jgi:serine/threonine protein kinase
MTEGAVEDKYHMKRVLGKGAYASVWSSTHKVTGERYAVKAIDFANLPAEKLEKTLAQVRLPHTQVRHICRDP